MEKDMHTKLDSENKTLFCIQQLLLSWDCFDLYGWIWYQRQKEAHLFFYMQI